MRYLVGEADFQVDQQVQVKVKVVGTEKAKLILLQKGPIVEAKSQNAKIEGLQQVPSNLLLLGLGVIDQGRVVVIVKVNLLANVDSGVMVQSL